MNSARSARDRNPLLALVGVVTNRCPKCLEGHVWRTLWTMNDACNRCGYGFNREPGYFTSAMPLSYGLGAALVLPLFLVLGAKGYPAWQAVGIPALVLALLSPVAVRFSRLLLLHTDPKPFDEA